MHYFIPFWLNYLHFRSINVRFGLVPAYDVDVELLAQNYVKNTSISQARESSYTSISYAEIPVGSLFIFPVNETNTTLGAGKMAWCLGSEIFNARGSFFSGFM